MLMINVYNYPLEMQKYLPFRMINCFLEVLKVPPPLRNIALEKDDNYTIIVYLQVNALNVNVNVTKIN